MILGSEVFFMRVSSAVMASARNFRKDGNDESPCLFCVFMIPIFEVASFFMVINHPSAQHLESRAPQRSNFDPRSPDLFIPAFSILGEVQRCVLAISSCLRFWWFFLPYWFGGIMRVPIMVFSDQNLGFRE